MLLLVGGTTDMDTDQHDISQVESKDVSRAPFSFLSFAHGAALRWIIFALAFAVWIPSTGARAERHQLVIDAARSNLEWEYVPAPYQPQLPNGFTGRAPITAQGSLVLDIWAGDALVHSNDLSVKGSGEHPDGGSVAVDIDLPFRGVPASRGPAGVMPDEALVMEASSGTITRSFGALSIAETRDLALNGLTFRDDGGPRLIQIDWTNMTWSLRTELQAVLSFAAAPNPVYREEVEIRLQLVGTIEPAPLASAVIIETPAHGSFTGSLDVVDETVAVIGRVEGIDPSLSALVINGADVVVDAQGGFVTRVALGTGAHFPIDAEVTEGPTGLRHRDRIVVIQGESVGENDHVDRGATLRLTNLGLNQAAGFASVSAEDLAALSPPVGTLVDERCSIEFFLCLQRVETRVSHATTIGRIDPPRITTVFKRTSRPPFHAIRITSVQRDVIARTKTRQTSGGHVDCDTTVRIGQLTTHSDLVLYADEGDRAKLLADNFDNSVVLGGVTTQVDCFGVGAEIIVGPARDRARTQSPQQTRTSVLRALNRETNGKKVVERQIESALDAVDVTGPLSEQIMADLEALLVRRSAFSQADANGISLVFDTRVTPRTVNEMAPELDQSLLVPGSFEFGALTPGGERYDSGIAISLSAINQFFRGLTEGGILEQELAQDVSLNAGTLSGFVPGLARLLPTTPLKLQMRGTLAPVMTGRPGPDGELIEVSVAQILVDIVDNERPGQAVVDATNRLVLERPPGGVWMTLAIDLIVGVNPRFDPATRLLNNDLGVLQSSNVVVRVLDSVLGGDPAITDVVFPVLIASAGGDVLDVFDPLPIPALLGLGLVPDEIVLSENHLVVLGDLVATGDAARSEALIDDAVESQSVVEGPMPMEPPAAMESPMPMGPPAAMEGPMPMEPPAAMESPMPM